MLQTRVGLTRADVVGEEIVIYSFEKGQLRSTLGRKLGMPVTSFMAYLKLIEKEAKIDKSNSPPEMSKGSKTFRKR